MMCGCTMRGSGDTSVFGRPWTFTAVSASISATEANGTAWDVDNSAPDPFARLYLDGQLVGTTPEIDDTDSPVWDYSPSPIVIEEGSTLSLDLIDSDTFDDDVIFQGCGIPLTVDFADAGGASCESSQGSLRIAVSVD
jgi:hypothetical protein